MNRDLYIVFGAIFGIIVAVVYTRPVMYGVTFPLTEAFEINSAWVRRTFASGDVERANTAVYAFYAKIVVAMVAGAVVGYFLGGRSKKSL